MAFHIDARMEQRNDMLSHPTHNLTTAARDRAMPRTEDPQAVHTSREQIEPVLRELEAATNFLHRKLKFAVNKDLNRVIIKVIDAETDKVIKELPPEELQRVSLRIREAVGLLIDEEI
ncbi:flagellar protein FlaG [Spirochaeta africana]|uniref:Flagellar protein FlaG n=1 Tax=Spirochaeta africana (strain ATCC 700263 / DSM 8902 / Z-7692) TaxID=889378 RepID=H9UHA5_SPIAZ|nr:flagellar protein FlaG [Spirochaeta africana]AFG36898.1 flagellar protein FlaG [Spirochaeta africana DSM 8902]